MVSSSKTDLCENPLKGEYNHSVDAKGRMIVPSKLREQLGMSFVVTRGMDGCLFAYHTDILCFPILRFSFAFFLSLYSGEKWENPPPRK